MILRSFLIVVILNLYFHTQGQGQENWDSDQRAIIFAMDKLSESTAGDNLGADVYAASLTEDFNRWTIGSEEITYKKEWVDDIRDWYDDGWRVPKRENNIISISVNKKTATVRRIVKEYYKGPQGETSDSKAGLVEVWKKIKGEWKLHSVNVVAPID